MGKTCWLLLSILAASYVCDAYKILVIFPLPGKSHTILGNAVCRHLLNAGHEVTYISPFIDKNPHPNLHQVDVSSNWGLIPEGLLNVTKILTKEIDLSGEALLLFLFQMMATATLKNENVQNLLADRNQHFDAVIAEWMYNELYAGLPAIFGAPLIWVSTIEPHGMILSLVDEYLNPSYNGYFIDDGTVPFTFMQRATELWDTIIIMVMRETIIRVMQMWQYNRLIVPHIQNRGKLAPSFEELKYNGSLVLGNSHVSLGEPTRLPQSYKHIGGYHVTEEVKPLPDDLQKLMDESKDGVIYFSMGSNLKSKDLPELLKKDLVTMFGNFKQTVLWKFEEEFPNLPKNVHILKWAPQASILAHPNCVLFITHGGLLSTTETIHAGVPIIGIPVFGDQFINVNSAVNKGFCKKVSLSFNMTEELEEAIRDILTDPTYTQKVKELSFIYHDRPVKPGAELVHWVEHVIKTGGAPHLRSPALLVSWYQKYYLDLLILLVLAGYILNELLLRVMPVILPKRFVKEKTM